MQVTLHIGLLDGHPSCLEKNAQSILEFAIITHVTVIQHLGATVFLV